MKIKYAYIVLNHMPFPFPEIGEPFYFDDTTVIRLTNVSTEFLGEDSKHWADWLGTITWERLTQPQYVLATWIETNTPDVLDDENKFLSDKVSTIFRSLKLAGAFAPPDEALLFAGYGVIENGFPKAMDVKSYTDHKTWTRSMFSREDDFFDWAMNNLSTREILDKWKSYSEHLNNLFNEKKNRQLLEAFRSFEEALSATQLEFKMPNLVRALECIIECWGKDQFAERVLFLLGHMDKSLPLEISTDTSELLKDLYQLRNDCSHGKFFAYSLEKKIGSPPTDSLVATYEFLAEWAARRILTDSFTNSSILNYATDRDTLVKAWGDGLINRS